MKDYKTAKFGAIFAILFAVCIIFTTKTQAADVSATTISLNNSWYSGEISTEGEVDFYKFSISKAGWVTIDYQGWSVADSYVQVLDNDLSTSYEKSNVYTSNSINPITKTFTLALEPGTYYVKIWAYGSHTGDYKVKGSFEAANNNESSNNNDFGTAMNLSLNQSVTGFLSIDDKVDFYKINISKQQAVRLIYTSYISDTYMQVWNSDFIEISKKNLYTASKTAPLTYVYEAVLSPGTYYIKIYPYSSGTGKYVLKYEQKVLVSSIKVTGSKSVVAGKSVKLNAAISPANASVKTIRWTSGNTSIASVDANGKVTTHTAGTVNITAAAQDGSNKTKVYTIIVKPKKIAKPYLANYSAKKLYVSWNTQSGVSGYQIQYATNKKFSGAKTVKASKNRSYKNIKVSKKRYYVRVRAYYKKGSKYYYGTWSASRNIRIKK